MLSRGLLTAFRNLLGGVSILSCNATADERRIRLREYAITRASPTPALCATGGLKAAIPLPPPRGFETVVSRSCAASV